MNPDLDQLSVATLRALAMDDVQEARPGRPGTPMALLHLSGVKAVDPDCETLGGPAVRLVTPDAIVSTARALLGRGEG